MEINLKTALRFNGPELPAVAFVGAGGKTSAMFALARQCQQALVTTTTHLGAWQASFADHHFVIESAQEIVSAGKNLSGGVNLLSGPVTPDERLVAPAPQALDALHHLAKTCQLPLLIEADGARQLPLKAPGEHEPAIPDFVEIVIVVAGLSALNRPLSPAWVHRPERFAALAALEPDALITPAAVANVLAHPLGGLKAMPAQARRICLLTQANEPERQADAGWIARKLSTCYDAILVAANQPDDVLLCFEPTAGIVLAAGAASRYGQPKQLLTWEGEQLVRRSARIALEAGLSPVIVVSGAYPEGVTAAVAGLDVRIVHCPGWAEGQAASIRAGLQAAVGDSRRGDVPPPGSAIFLLADQPHVTPLLLRRLCEAHAHRMKPILAPLVDGRRSNPVLFDRVTFAELMALQGDVGGRALFTRYSIEWIPWLDPMLLLDVDTPDDYRNLSAS